MAQVTGHGFVEKHRQLLYKHARAHVRARATSVSVEDVYREAELVIVALAKKDPYVFDEIYSVDAWLREVARHGTGRARRRKKIVEQIAAGDDLAAVVEDLSKLDDDTPVMHKESSRSARSSQEKLDAIKKKLPVHDALVFALLIEDDIPVGDVAELLCQRPGDVGHALERILEAAKETQPEAQSSPDQTMNTGFRRVSPEQTLRFLGTQAACVTPSGDHQDDALLALIRSGDMSDDISDVVAHVAGCPECRARLTEGPVDVREVVVVAIEAQRGTGRHIHSAAGHAHARVLDRGEGRWTAIVDADQAAALVQQLEQSAGASISRMAQGDSFFVPTDQPPLSRRGGAIVRAAGADVHFEPGIAAAETHAWARVAVANPKQSSAFSILWVLVGILALGGAGVLGYFLATR